MTETYNLLAHNYVKDDDKMFIFDSSKELLLRALSPARIWIRDDVVNMAEINFFCVHNKLRSKGLAPLMVKELTRWIHLDNI